MNPAAAAATWSPRLKIAAVIVSKLVLVLAMAAPAAAADFVVSDCGDDGGPNQLRAKINEANVALGGSITFSCGPGTITLASPLPNILAEITIDGGGQIALSGDDKVTVLNSFSTLHLVDLDIRDGRAAGNGGAVYTANSTLTMENVTIESSRALNDGGALYISNSTVTIEDSRLSGNEAVGDGGAIYNFKGAVTFVNVEADGNTSGAFGGAFYNDAGQVAWTGGTMTGNDAYDAGAVFTLDRGLQPAAKTTLGFVLVSGNQAVNAGGAFYVFLGAALDVGDSLVADNEAGGDGGGVYNEGDVVLERVLLRSNVSAGSGGALAAVSGESVVLSSTLYDNEAQIGASVANGDANVELTNVTIFGGDASETSSLLQYSSGSIRLTNTILEHGGLSANCILIDDDNGAIVSDGHNLSDDNSCLEWLADPSDRNSTDAMLGPLTDNGGVTHTMVPQPGSVAVDGVDGEICPDDDQRGVPRPEGTACDIGAIEVVTCGASVPVLCGDANADDSVTAPDALQTLRTSVGTASCELWLCDFNGVGGVTAADALVILRTAVGQPTTPNCPAAYDCFDYFVGT
jgi:hypothetical protein